MGPLLQCDGESLLDRLLGYVKVADQPDDGGQHTPELVAVELFDTRAFHRAVRRMLWHPANGKAIGSHFPHRPHFARVTPDHQAPGPLDGFVLRIAGDDEVAGDE